MNWKTSKQLFIEFLIKYNLYNIQTKDVIHYALMNNKSFVYILNMLNKISYHYKWMDFFYKNTILYKIFLRFLKENNILNKYLINMELQNKTLDSFDFINTFIWDNTNEGYDFWAKKEDQWNNIRKIIGNIVTNEGYDFWIKNQNNEILFVK